MFFDTHVHFEQRDGENGYVAVMERARRAGVNRVLAVGVSAESNAVALAAAHEFPGTVHAAIGLDRDTVGTSVSEAECHALVDGLRRQFRDDERASRAVVAIGEIGLDFHYAPASAAGQAMLFRMQLELARELHLPVIVHSREAETATLDALAEHAASAGADAPGVLHCFTGSREFAQRLIDLGYCISFSGIVTFRNADRLRAIARSLPADRLLIETDSPYLAPEPQRGRRNEPALISHIAGAIAQLRNCTSAVIAEQTAENACRLFGL